MTPQQATLLVELIEKVGLLKRELEHNQDRERYEARLARIEQKLFALADAMVDTNPDSAAAIRKAWATPARSLAFRNAAHQKAPRSSDDR
jgi:hypothetical protein